MQRNFFRRVETCFPVLDPKLKKRVIKEGLDAYLSDNVQAWEMNAGGAFERKTPRRNTRLRCAQVELLEELAKPGK